eukprot:SAG31_NODE_36675_length_311_cov_0.801887_1_plen_53_part_10
MALGVHGCACGVQYFAVPVLLVPVTGLQVLVLLVLVSGSRYGIGVHGCIVSHM